MNSTVNILHIDTFRAADAAGAIAGIWRDASDVDDITAESFAIGTFPKHVNWPGFRLHMAVIEGLPVGFVYGYHSLPGQWWHDQVHYALTGVGRQRWLKASYELAEIAVLPQFQGRGIGNQLIKAFLEDIESPVLLALEAEHENAHAMYISHGFEDLLTDFYYPGWDDRIIVMGRPAPEG